MADKITQTIEVVADTTEASKEIGKLQDKANRLSSSLESIRIGRKGDAGVLVNALDRSVKQSSMNQVMRSVANRKRHSTALTTVPFSRLSEEDKIRSVVQDLSKVKQGIAPDPELRKRTLSLATSMLRKGRATTGLGLKPSFEFYAPKGKLSKPADEFLRGVLNEANAINQDRKKDDRFNEKIALMMQRQALKAEEEKQNFISKSRERTSLSSEIGARKTEKFFRQRNREDVKAWAKSEHEMDQEREVRGIQDASRRLAYYEQTKGKKDNDYRNLIKNKISSLDKTTKKQYAYEIYNAKKTAGIGVPGAVGGIAKIASKFVAPLAIADAVRKVMRYLWNAGKEGLREGYDVLSERAIYGQDRAIGLTKMMTDMFKIDANAAANVDRYARDFRQRMMWGEVGEREAIGLGRMGEAGAMIMSGRAAEDPRTFLKQLRGWMLNTDAASVRHTLGQLNWSKDLMKLKLNNLSESEFEDMIDNFDAYMDVEAKAAADALAIQQDIRVLERNIQANTSIIAGAVARFFTSDEKRLAAYRNAGMSDEDIERVAPGLMEKVENKQIYAEDKMIMRAAKEEEARMRKARTPKAPKNEYMAPKIGSITNGDMLVPLKPNTKPSDYEMYPGYTPSPNINNNTVTVPVTINGDVDERTARNIGNIIGEETVVAMSKFLSKTAEV